MGRKSYSKSPNHRAVTQAAKKNGQQSDGSGKGSTSWRHASPETSQRKSQQWSLEKDDEIGGMSTFILPSLSLASSVQEARFLFAKSFPLWMTGDTANAKKRI